MRLAVILCAVLLQLPQTTVPGTLTPADREAAVKHLEQTRQTFVEAISGLSDAQWTYKAAPDRWSIAEAAEHIAVSESVILQLITEKVMKSPAPPADFTRPPDQKVIDVVVDRSQKAQAPELLQPTRRYATRDALLKEFQQARQKTIDWVKATKEDLRGHVAPHPAFKAGIDGYQWVLLLSAHSARHTAQIDEVKAAPGYPKK